MGASGSAWASFSVRVFSAILIVLYIWNLRDRDLLRIRKRSARTWSSWAHQRRIGYSAGFSNGVESAAFSAMNIFAGLWRPASGRVFSRVQQLGVGFYDSSRHWHSHISL